MEGRIFTVKTVLTDYFQGAVGETKLRELVRKEKIPYFRIGAKIYFREDSLDAWTQEKEQHGNTQTMKLRAVK
jgi:hypothetical protein